MPKRSFIANSWVVNIQVLFLLSVLCVAVIGGGLGHRESVVLVPFLFLLLDHVALISE